MKSWAGYREHKRKLDFWHMPLYNPYIVRFSADLHSHCREKFFGANWIQTGTRS